MYAYLNVYLLTKKTKCKVLNCNDLHRRSYRIKKLTFLTFFSEKQKRQTGRREAQISTAKQLSNKISHKKKNKVMHKESKKHNENLKDAFKRI